MPETPAHQGPYDVEPGTGRLGYRGLLGTVAHWARPLPGHEVKHLWRRSHSANLFHPLPGPEVSVQPVLGPGDVWAGTRGQWTQEVWTYAEEVTQHVRRGGTLVLPVERQEELRAVQRLGYGVEAAEALPAAGPSVKRDVAGYFLEAPGDVPAGVPALAFGCRALPPGARVLYGHGVVDAFLAHHGEGRVAYLGYNGPGAEPAAGWKSLFARLLRGQTGFDV